MLGVVNQKAKLAQNRPITDTVRLPTAAATRLAAMKTSLKYGRLPDALQKQQELVKMLKGSPAI
jgi:hypothetical protein